MTHKELNKILDDKIEYNVTQYKVEIKYRNITFFEW